MSDQFDLHRRRLAGEDVPLSEGSPQSGYYRRRHQGGWKPVAIWVKDGTETFFVHVDGRSSDDYAAVLREWGLCCRFPITQETWKAVAIDGQAWPDEPPATIGDNLPEDPVERFKVLIEQEEDATAAFLATPITDEESATKCGLWSKKVSDLMKAIEDERKARKKPLDDAAKEIQATFTPLADRAERLTRRLKLHMEAFLLEKRRRVQEEERQRREAEAAARAKAAEEIGVAPPPAPAAAAKPRVVTGGVALRTKREVVFTDYDAAFEHAIKDPAFRKQDAVQKIIRAMAEHTIVFGKSDFPGAKMETREYVA